MKYIALLFTATILFAGCSKRNRTRITASTKIIVVDDITDSLILHPLPDPVLALYGFDKNKKQEASFEYVVLSNRLLSPTKSLHLSDGETSEESNVRDDPRNRDRLIQNFYSNVRTVFDQFPVRFRNPQSQDRSMCFCTISLQLRKLAASRYQKKVLIVFSNIMENSNTFNIYNPESRNELQEDAEAVGERLSQQCSIPKKLDGVTIFFVFQPATREEDERFMDLVSMYSMMLEKRGARIKIQANNEQFQLNDE